MDDLLSDPTLAIKWLLILVGFGAIYMQLRRWEARVSGKLERVEVAQPIEIVGGKQYVTRDTLDPVVHRVSALETEVRTIREKMEANKQEVLHKISELQEQTQAGFRSLERAIGRLEGGQIYD